VGYIILSGDLTGGGKPEEYAKVRAFIAGLSDYFKVEAQRFVIVPGNHDYDRKLSHQAYAIRDDKGFRKETFSFSEFLDYQGIDHKDAFARSANRIDIARAMDEYLKWGGFYEVFSVESPRVKKELLVSYARNILYQDVIPRYNIRQGETLERLFFYLLANSGGVLNHTTLAQTFDISDKTVREYLAYFEEVFLLKRIEKFHSKEKERIKAAKKIYALDNGFLQIAPSHSENLGRSLENLVFTQLNRTGKNVAYFREAKEIDFVCDRTLSRWPTGSTTTRPGNGSSRRSTPSLPSPTCPLP